VTPILAHFPGSGCRGKTARNTPKELKKIKPYLINIGSLKVTTISVVNFLYLNTTMCKLTRFLNVSLYFETKFSPFK
jgi:hypothetical protein